MCGIAGVIGGDPKRKEQLYIEHEVDEALRIAHYITQRTVSSSELPKAGSNGSRKTPVVMNSRVRRDAGALRVPRMQIAASTLRRLPLRLASEARRSFLWMDRQPDLPVVLVSGVARSGSTWIAEVLSHATRARLIFEPFAPDFFPAYTFNNFTFHLKDDEDPALEAFCARLFGGRMRHRWIDSEPNTIRPRVRLVKAVRANLMLGWLGARFPDVRIILVSRNPWSVVRSRVHLHWDPQPDLQALACQPRLLENLGTLADDVFAARRMPEPEANAVLWAVNTRAPLVNPPPDSWIDCRYEALAANPQPAFTSLLERLGLPVYSRLRHLRRPSMNSNRLVARSSGYGQFRTEFGDQTARRVADIAERWGLERWLCADPAEGFGPVTRIGRN